MGSVQPKEWMLSLQSLNHSVLCSHCHWKVMGMRVVMGCVDLYTALQQSLQNRTTKLISSLLAWNELTYINKLRNGKSKYCIKAMLILCRYSEDAPSLPASSWKSENLNAPYWKHATNAHRQTRKWRVRDSKHFKTYSLYTVKTCQNSSVFDIINKFTGHRP